MLCVQQRLVLKVLVVIPGQMQKPARLWLDLRPNESNPSVRIPILAPGALCSYFLLPALKMSYLSLSRLCCPCVCLSARPIPRTNKNASLILRLWLWTREIRRVTALFQASLYLLLVNTEQSELVRFAITLVPNTTTQAYGNWVPRCCLQTANAPRFRHRPELLVRMH